MRSKINDVNQDPTKLMSCFNLSGDGVKSNEFYYSKVEIKNRKVSVRCCINSVSS